MGEAKPASLSLLARQLVEQGENRGTRLRLIGSIAIRERCGGDASIFTRLDREPPIDIDLVGYARQRLQISQMFKELGYRLDATIAQSQEWGIQRLIYYAPDTDAKVDIFLDVLRMSHTIDFRNRLSPGTLTVAPADLLLAKLQVVKITEKDLKDIAVLLLTHQFGEGPDAIDITYLVRSLSDDWGLYHTALNNLRHVGSWMQQVERLTAAESATIRARVSQLSALAEASPKSLGWRLRATIGPRMQWYEEVGEVER